ncbi:MAG TPA: tRNA lysidine(34) synthetase TilS [Vicinamibacteria bacterium]|nr:tRNA lysidine(34) synthetase TilS [Vicinamibacteria bacterium]
MLVRRVSATIERYEMVSPGERVLVGVSGGADSVALAQVMAELGHPLAVAHLNHGLRSDADQDEIFASALAQRLGVPFVSDRLDLLLEARKNRRSIEDEGHQARYRFFKRSAARLRCTRIAVGHTMDDQAETFLLRLLRGSGTRGLAAAYPKVDGLIIRPLLEARRSDVEEFLHDRGLTYRQDSSNQDLRFARNRVRHMLLPELRRHFNPRVVEALAGAAALLQDDEGWMERLTADALGELARETDDGALVLDVSPLAHHSDAMKRRIVRQALSRVRGHLRNVGRAHVDQVLSLLADGKSGRELHLPGVLVRRSFDRLIMTCEPGRIERNRSKHGYNGFEYRLPIPAKLLIRERGGTLTAAWRRSGATEEITEPKASGDSVVLALAGEFPELMVRSARRGDRFRPLGASGSKPLTRYLMERKVPSEKRWAVPLVARARGGEILWVVGHGVSESSRLRSGVRQLELGWVGG